MSGTQILQKSAFTQDHPTSNLSTPCSFTSTSCPLSCLHSVFCSAFSVSTPQYQPQHKQTCPRSIAMPSSASSQASIPDSLGTSSFLSYVDLANNTLTGNIPLSLASSSSLSTLILSRNRLSGEIPSTLFGNSSKLTVVDLQMNFFTGPIPHFHKVTTLKFLCLTDNFLSGSIPPSIGNFSSLASISLVRNRLSGLIPETLSHITKLLELDLSFNSLSGSVPLSFYNMTSLEFFNVGSNALVGQMPSHIGFSLPNLQFLIMGSNRLEGLIPASLSNMLNLQTLDLSNNLLHGSVPYLGSLANLHLLDLGINLLEAHDWSFLTSLANCTQLTKLSLEGNLLNGSLPISIVNLSRRLEHLSLGSNQILGSIPAEISKFVNLTSLGMESNFLSGSIPSTIGKLQNLYILNLSKNKLSGQIPPSVGGIAQLGKLYLDDNNLSGNIPGSLGQCKGLLELNLSRNNLDGSVPDELFAYPPLSLVLDFSHNNLTGELPLVVGTHSSGGPVSLHMEGNKFHGQIPERWHLLVSTQQINLSHNDLSGAVPEFFERFDMLKQLDLSYNNLEGSVPTSGIFKKYAAVVLGGNKGLCLNSSKLIKIRNSFRPALPVCPRISALVTKSKHHLSFLATSLLIVLPTLSIGSLVLLWFLLTLWKKGLFSSSRWDLVSKLFPNRREVPTVPCHDEKKLKRVSYEDILKATNWFSLVHTISSTCTGSVYVGRFKSDKSLVAIKVFNLNEPGGYNSYLIECEVLRSTRHRNIMRPVTLCSTLDSQNHEFKALIFEFMVNGSLEKWLHSDQHNGIADKGLSFAHRICIAADVASALDYAHNELTPPLIHCDLKPNNVLLDDDMTARLSDFGSGKFLSPGLLIPKSLDDVGGTIGYVAPEYGMGCEISVADDVYSFGVLLLELLTGKRPTDDMFVDGLSLCKFCESMFPDRVAEILDPHMAHEEHQGCAEAWMQRYIVPLVALGLSCTLESPKDRPGMKDVCAKLSDIRASFLELS
ncbi:hypothetical protein CFC21_021313 [Triticum aestivum]|uniref:non-specific serine/threonine protein kinase n=2 Tax=Triticum aestivum TaxID=4565 RepID=A0A9R1E9L9_WHEAT|nr:probable LRR receptor-like serine/threonine-protein kinase At3g47570 [Triticum aestivum]KAF7006259.1 hypothetical protein CFC21_021313 [Triticum aestivum]